MPYQHNPIAIIPARGGSRRIPGKNIKPFFGKPIIQYTIEKANASGLFSDIVVSTDSEEIAQVVRHHGAHVHMRPAEYGKDEVGTQEVARQYVRTLANYPLMVCVIYATAPLMRIEDLHRGYELMVHTNRDFVFSVQASPLQDAGQFYWSWTPRLLDGSPLVGDRTGLIPIPKGHVCDINTMADWYEAERLFALLGKS